MSDLGAQSFDAATQKELTEFVSNELAKRKYQESVQKFTGMCWDKCITSVTSSQLGRNEESCLANCVDRFLDASMYIVSQVQEKRNQL
ncbi:Tim10/DDP family zinc finger-domain-containing protein [Coprinopsis sp. MPI-PUGE-AT-0042]|nr:Tim10/DDP family zinc finger-domain-containing protein [Coprinopsis sp. MPI-PUGE-AT-0042]